MKAAEDDGRAHTGDAEQVVVVVEGMATIGNVVGRRMSGSASAGEEGARKKMGLRRKPINCLNSLLDWNLQNESPSISQRSSLSRERKHHYLSLYFKL